MTIGLTEILIRSNSVKTKYHNRYCCYTLLWCFLAMGMYDSVIVNCPLCGREEEYGKMYEYRGALACCDCIEEAREKRDAERAEVIAEQNHKTDRFKGLDLSDSTIGKANQQILQIDIEVAKKESKRIRDYEGRD